MKILIVGDFIVPIYEQAFYNAFLKLGYNVSKFAIGDYLQDRNFFIKLQNKFLCGPILWRINKDLISWVKMEKPDLIFVYRGNYIYPKTIQELRKTGALVFGYNNDDPFSEKHPFYLFRHFRKSVPFYDHIFVYRYKNVDDYQRVGYYRVSLLRSYYIKEKNFPIEKLPTNEYVCDVIFVGHYENDGRDEYIKAILDSGIAFKLFGGSSWLMSKYYNFFYKRLGEPKYLGEAYNLALNSAKIALCFLSKLNNDTYTRRNFEIPATKTFMLSEYSDDLNSMFQEGKEAEYFRNKEEMLEKIKYYLIHDKEREKIAEAGYKRLLKDGCEALDRVKEIIRVFESYKNKKL
jgi:spore maturation protein CgeB